MRDRSAVGVMYAAEVLLHPTLVADLHRVVLVAVVVLHRGGAAHEVQVVHHALQAVQLLLQPCDVGDFRLVEDFRRAGSGVPVSVHLRGNLLQRDVFRIVVKSTYLGRNGGDGGRVGEVVVIAARGYGGEVRLVGQVVVAARVSHRGKGFKVVAPTVVGQQVVASRTRVVHEQTAVASFDDTVG